jgi:acetyl esterase/lipase
VETTFNWLIAQGYSPEKVIAIGHSVGGFLAPALALRLRDVQKPTPGVIVSISPWCDLEIVNETMVSNAASDKLLSKDLLEFFREAWIGGTVVAPEDVRVNLNRSDLKGLHPTLVSWGTYEILAGEDEIFARRLQEAGVDTKVLPIPGPQHWYVHGAGRVPEADAAIAEIAAWIREKALIQAR